MSIHILGGAKQYNNDIIIKKKNTHPLTHPKKIQQY